MEWVGNVPETHVQSAIISKLKLANGDYLEQWHDQYARSGRTLSTADKKVFLSAHFRLLQWQAQKHTQGTVPPGDDREEKRLSTDGKRISKSKKRKRN